MTADAGALRVGIIGFGRIGQRIAARLAVAPDGIVLAAVLMREHQCEAAGRHQAALVGTALDAFLAAGLDLVVECASAQTLRINGPRVLAAGIDLMPLSLAAFADPAAEADLRAAAQRGPGRLELPAGAAGTLGLIAAAREDDLRSVRFCQSYPPSIWRNTAAAGMVALDAATTRSTFFRGSVREAARLFPRNLNVAVGVALAGLGLDRTEVELAVDPAIPHANYVIEIDAGPGPVRLAIGHRDAPEGSDPADYTAFSVLRLLRRRRQRVMI